MADSQQIQPERRKFLSAILSGSLIAVAGAIVYPVFRFLTPPPQEAEIVASVNLGKSADFPVNAGKIFRFGNRPGIIIRGSDNKLRAFSATCTHLDCIVQYDAKAECIWCACHNGRYDLNGLNISGPPPRPLTQFKVNVTPDSDEVIITMTEGKEV
jgi:Rieske Fe-S protein